MRWILLLVLTFSSVIIHLFISWIADERDVLSLNQKVMIGEIKKIKELETLDKSIQAILEKNKIKISDKQFARKKLLRFFDKNQNRFGLKLKRYFQSKSGMLSLEMSALLKDSRALEEFFKLLEKDLLLEIERIEKDEHSIHLDFKALYPYKEYL